MGEEKARLVAQDREKKLSRGAGEHWDMPPPQESQLRLERDQKSSSSPGPDHAAVTPTAVTQPCQAQGMLPPQRSFLPAPAGCRLPSWSPNPTHSSDRPPFPVTHRMAPPGQVTTPGHVFPQHVPAPWGRDAANLGRVFANWTAAPRTDFRESGSATGSGSQCRLEKSPCPMVGVGAHTRLPRSGCRHPRTA